MPVCTAQSCVLDDACRTIVPVPQGDLKLQNYKKFLQHFWAGTRLYPPTPIPERNRAGEYRLRPPKIMAPVQTVRHTSWPRNTRSAR
eukprot:2281103-Rhodomonas_salina.4